MQPNRRQPHSGVFLRWVLAILVGLAGLAGLAAPAAHAQQQREPPGYTHWQSVIKGVMDANAKRLLVGDVDGYVEAVRAAARPDDWTSLLVAGDALYSVAPAAAISLHEAAARLAPGEGMPILELAFDYQRTGQCELAADAWKAADRFGALYSPVPGIAAYCFFRLGRIDEALALWSRVHWPSHRVPLDRLVSERAVGTQAQDIHNRAYAQARAGDEKAFGVLVANALKWRPDLWNERVHRQAFDAARELARQVWPSNARLHRELDCVDEVLSAFEADAVRGVLRRYGFLVDDGGLPLSPDVTRFLFARLDRFKLESTAELLRRHGPALDARARSEAGDLPALEVLAFLQVSSRDLEALKATDDLGWRRYRVAKFAVSRMAGLTRDPAAWESHGRQLLDEALKDFPGEAYLHELRYTRWDPPPSQRERYLVEWALAEYEGLSTTLLLLPSTRTLVSVVRALHELRQGRGPDRTADGVVPGSAGS